MQYEDSISQGNISSKHLLPGNAANFTVDEYNQILLYFNLSLVPLILVGNTLVLLAIYHCPKLRTITNLFVASLAVADFLVGLLTIPLYSTYYLNVSSVYNNKWACLAIYASLVESCGSSLFHLATIAIDRYIAIVHPLRYAGILTWYRAKICLLILWTYTSVISALPAMGWNKWTSKSSCYVYEILPVGYTVLASLTTVSGVLILTTVLYTLILVEISKKLMSSHDRRLTKLSKDMQSGLVMALVSVLFVVFWFPYMVVSSMNYISGYSKTKGNLIKNFTLTLAMSNSVINPIVYGCLRKDFQSAYYSFLHYKGRQPLKTGDNSKRTLCVLQLEECG